MRAVLHSSLVSLTLVLAVFGDASAQTPPRKGFIERTPDEARVERVLQSLCSESRPYLATARNAWESSSRRVPSCAALFQVVPQSPATYVQHGGRGERSDSWAATSDAGLSVGMSCRFQFGEAGERKIRIVDVHVRFGGPLPEGRDVLASFEP